MDSHLVPIGPRRHDLEQRPAAAPLERAERRLARLRPVVSNVGRDHHSPGAAAARHQSPIDDARFRQARSIDDGQVALVEPVFHERDAQALESLRLPCGDHEP